MHNGRAEKFFSSPNVEPTRVKDSRFTQVYLSRTGPSSVQPVDGDCQLFANKCGEDHCSAGRFGQQSPITNFGSEIVRRKGQEQKPRKKRMDHDVVVATIIFLSR